MNTARDLAPAVLSRLDEPSADASVLPTYVLSRFARQHVTVALTGDGGDELFAGYDPFAALAAAPIESTESIAAPSPSSLAYHETRRSNRSAADAFIAQVSAE